MSSNTQFGTIDYAPELFRVEAAVDIIDTEKTNQLGDLTRLRNAANSINNSLHTIDTHLKDIQADMNVIETRIDLIKDSISVFEDLGTNCNKGIRTVDREDGISRALSIMSLKDTEQFELYKQYLDDAGYTDYNDFLSVIDGS